MWCGRRDEHTSLPKRATCLVEIISIEFDSKEKLRQPVRNTFMVSKYLGGEEESCGLRRCGDEEEIRDKLAPVPAYSFVLHQTLSSVHGSLMKSRLHQTGT